MVVCRTCGFQNDPGDAFCGSCGDFLEWSGEPISAEEKERAVEEDQRPDEEIAITPLVDGTSDGSLQPAEETTCAECGRPNPATRTFCKHCGTRLAAVPEPGRDDGPLPPGPDGPSRLLIAVGIAALLLLVGGTAVAFALYGGDDGAALTSPTATATASPEATQSVEPTPALVSPTPTATPPRTASPSPTPMPTAPPTPTPAPPTPTPAAYSCAGSTAPSDWRNLSPSAETTTLPDDRAWCIHQLVFVRGDGRGRIGLYAGEVLIYEVVQPDDFTEGAEIIVDYAPPLLVQPTTQLRYVAVCEDPSCSALIQVGHEPVSAP